MAVGVEKGTPIINQVIPDQITSSLPPLGTTNPHKVKEFAAGMGMPIKLLQTVEVDVDEIQDESLEKVVEKKAKAAYEAAGGIPVIVEDTGLTIYEMSDICQPPFVKFWAGDRNKRKKLCKILDGEDRSAQAETIYAVYDGQEVQSRKGRVTGRIAEKPVGNPDFGWDDIFIPDGQEALEGWEEGSEPRTFAQMSLDEKMELSMRQEAIRKILEDPFSVGIWVHALAKSLDMELDSIDEEYFKGEAMAQARKHAFGLRSLGGMQENESLTIEEEDLPPFYEVRLHEDIWQYTHDPSSPDLGLIVNGYDLRKLPNGQPTRLVINPDGRPSFMQHEADSYRRALAERAYEYSIHHNPEMYAKLRQLMKEKTPTRPNQKSPILEALLGQNGQNGHEITPQEVETFSVPGFTDLAYARQYSEESQSRTAAAMNHILNRNGVPTSVFALGGMPPVTGSRDVVTTAALSFMRSYIPHNSLFVDFDRRKKMFDECKTYVEDMIPGEENDDIRKLAVAQIGVCVSGKDIEAIANQTDELIQSGCGSLRIYTTNPGPEVVDAARAIGKTVKEKRDPNETLPFHLCVGPIVDIKQAEELLKVSQEYGIALTLLGGHGGGENCTSLEGGAAANAIEIIYGLSKREEFNDVSLGFEGGLGTWFGPWMGRIEQISKDGSMVRGCVETQGGLSILHKSGAPVQPYSGTASPWTQMVEEALGLADRTNPAGQLKNDEGKPGYMKTPHWAVSITHYFYAMRSMLGRTLADQRASSIDEIIANIKDDGDNHRAASPGSVATAKPHRPQM
ncbi:non-canonical purine NTP pyrophosphatase [Candidatus Roizmanbacteria bacterium]|nr:MAG: non-canonical purine NTP pyrophosphatase [Candidatus Roizmanbacteria bacterium]